MEYSQQDFQCVADLTQWMNSFSKGSYWALKMIDSWGSIPSGYLYGNTYDLGNYDECIRINKLVTSSQNIKGKYCFMKLPLAKYLLGMDLDISIVKMKIAICFPDSCTAQLMERLVGQLLQHLLQLKSANGSVSINENRCQTGDSQPLDGLTIYVIVILSLFGFATLLATLYDYFLCHDQDQLNRIVKIFSARANSRGIFRIVESKPNSNVIDCLHGLRCMSLIWVIFGHEYVYGLSGPNINQWALNTWFKKPFSLIILHAPFSVDTFFFISGLLLVVIGLRSMERSKGKLNIFLMYLHRYLRLTPILALAILVYWKLMPQLINGPLADYGIMDYSACERTWYKTLLYVQNYASSNMCLNHSWYLAVDMQLYLFSPILLIAVYKWGKKAAGGICILVILLSGCLFSTMLLNELSRENVMNSEESDRKLYYATHTHATPWLIGFLFGYFLHLNSGKRFQLSWPFVWLGWVLSLAMIFTCIYGTGGSWIGPSLSTLEQSFYYTLTRIGWPLALSWVVFACIQGYGGLANSFLSSPLWHPLSRLSYSVYIWHMFMQEINHRRKHTISYFTDYDMMLQFWSDFGFTVIISYVLYIAIEAPLGGLESLLLPNRKANSRPKSSPQPEVKKPTEVTASS
ncbi:uncharacterized protein Dwil_GK11404 [Drosophila willistoni]|uniref:Nose resistant-to-fluoxetine protein N-terminal domain-containing protein n=1 Tax=Drosophila willistoni TaxID=7260 RepID=B4NAC3_DROWI|nr:nose resistant to fluoxetine protein 6 [Drosophila willistoni]EDW80737.1 uncharacterized protein Dwil_GK11404 [Drosophila willistoni]